MRIDIKQHLKWPVSEAAILAIEHMLENMRFKASGADGGLEWEIELDGHVYSIDIDRDGKVRSTCADIV